MSSVILTIVAVGSYLFAKEIWLPEISRGAVKAEWNATAIGWTGSMILCVFGGSLATAWWVAANGGSFLESALAAFWVQVVINVWDVVVIDVVLYQWIQPSWMQYEGYPPIEGTWYHIEASLKGLVLGAVLSLISAGIALLA
ncbi:MAG: hypothetical protein AAGC60_20060 [Acidobacteriota bacterium]